MYFKLLLSLALLGMTTSLPTLKNEEFLKRLLMVSGSETERNSLIEQIILDALENLRDVMLTGTDDIPVLDPFQLDYFHVDDSIVPIPGAEITLEGVEVRQLSTFVIDSLRVQAQGLLQHNIDIEGHIPELELDSDKYDLSVTVAGFRIFGNGVARIQIAEPRVKAYLQIQIGIISGISVVQCEVRVSLKSFKSQLTGVFHDPYVSDFVSVFLENFVPQALDLFEEEITELLSAIVLQIANDLLNSSSLVNILDESLASVLRDQKFSAIEDTGKKL